MKRHIIGLAGEMASGKSTVAKYLISKHGAASHRFSVPLRDVLDRMGLPQSRENLGKLSTALRGTFGDDLFAKIVSQDVSADDHTVIVVDGVRRLSDIEHLRKLPEFRLVYIKVPLEARYDRIKHRKENSDDKGKSFETFQKEQTQEAETEIKGLEPHADVVIENDGTLNELYAKIDALMD